MPLPTAPTSNDIRPEKLRLLLAGKAGSGKTTFAAGWFPKTNLHIDFEGGTKFLPGSGFREYPKSYEDFTRTVNELLTTEHPFTTVTIDTADAMVRMADRDAAGGQEAAALVEFGKGIARRDARIQKDITRLLESNLGVIVLTHAMRLTEDVDGVEKTKWVPSLPTGSAGKPGLREFFLGIFDHVWFAEVSGAASDQRQIHAQPNFRFDLKSRTPVPDVLPMDPGAVYGALKQAIGSINTDPKDNA